MLKIAFTNILAFIDGRIHQRLSETRLIPFVVPQPPESIHVDDNILFELFAEIHSQVNYLGYRLGVLAIHVKNRYLKHFCDIGRISATTCFVGLGRKANLIVQDNVERTASSIAR